MIIPITTANPAKYAPILEINPTYGPVSLTPESPDKEYYYIDGSINNKERNFIKTEIHEDFQNFIIIISDNGIGINDESKKNIFKMFFRGTEISDGTGLGLYIAKLNIDKLNGQIFVENLVSERGTVFTMIFPKTL